MFRSLLPQNFEYEFFNAEYEYPAAEGVGEIFPGPYYCFYPVPTINNVEYAHQYVQDIIDEEGPFDAVMGFSQVCQLFFKLLLPVDGALSVLRWRESKSEQKFKSERESKSETEREIKSERQRARAREQASTLSLALSVLLVLPSPLLSLSIVSTLSYLEMCEQA